MRGESRGVSRVAKGTSGNLSHCLRKSGLLSSCKGQLGIPLESLQVIGPLLDLRRETWAFSTGTTGVSDLLSCCEGVFRVPFESVHGNWALSQVEGEVSVFLTCGRNHRAPLEFQ